MHTSDIKLSGRWVVTVVTRGTERLLRAAYSMRGWSETSEVSSSKREKPCYWWSYFFFVPIALPSIAPVRRIRGLRLEKC